MIAEYGLIPDVFDPVCYSSPEVCDLRLGLLKDCLLGRGVVRNLRDGKWEQCIEAQRDRWHPRAKEFLKKLKQQGRLRAMPACRLETPADGAGWCLEAIASHKAEPLRGIIADDITATSHESSEVVAGISRLGQAAWWERDSCSVEVIRSSDAYVKALAPTLRHSNSLMFIDAHLDPSADRYASVVKLLEACGVGQHRPKVEIHRVCYTGGGRERQFPDALQLRGMFLGPLRRVVMDRGLQVEVFVWDDFHDRFLISNLVGILLPNGFDVERAPTITRWARMDRKDRDSVQREFDPASKQHQLRDRFSVQ